MTNDCIPMDSSECNLLVFFFYFWMTSWVYTFIFTYLPGLVERLQQIRCKKSPITEDLVTEDVEESNTESENEIKENAKTIPIGAVVTLVIFFFQLAALIHIEPLQRNKISEDRTNENGFRKVLLETFNFRFAVYSELCPTTSLNLITKLIITFALKMSTLLNILWLFILYKGVHFIKCNGSKNT